MTMLSVDKDSRGIIEVGDEITNDIGELITITSVEKGKYGILWHGVFLLSGNPGWGFLPYELPPSERKRPWYGWFSRCSITLSSGHKLGHVGRARSDGDSWQIDKYDSEWERTVREIQSEEMASDD